MNKAIMRAILDKIKEYRRILLPFLPRTQLRGLD